MRLFYNTKMETPDLKPLAHIWKKYQGHLDYNESKWVELNTIIRGIYNNDDTRFVRNKTKNAALLQLLEILPKIIYSTKYQKDYDAKLGNYLYDSDVEFCSRIHSYLLRRQ